ncbi:MAG: hypothetical protein A2Y95_11275 [Deltaproteobacteria bacterium RBG_13_65_10]|nr:MAG: hypothetical protein A2Y95_11275 [Deltaproteobacteria bacterium RBG_13_65_10]
MVPRARPGRHLDATHPVEEPKPQRLGWAQRGQSDEGGDRAATRSAGGIGAIFNAPIAGAIFALEVILGDFGLATFAPALFLGVVLGGAYGHGVHALFPGHTAEAGAYALVGMGAVLAGAAQAPLTALLMAFEVTNNYQTILPVMLACSISAIIVHRYAKESMYTSKLARQGIDLRAGREANLLRVLTVAQAMSREVICVPESMKFGALLDLLARSRHSDFPVIDARGRLSGMISFQDYREVAFEKGLEDVLVVHDLMKTFAQTVTERDDLHTALERMGQQDLEEIPVVDVHDALRVVGILSRRDVVAAYNRAVVRLRTPPSSVDRYGGTAPPLESEEEVPG